MPGFCVQTTCVSTNAKKRKMLWTGAAPPEKTGKDGRKAQEKAG
jgi:hypothetical protein